MYRVLVTARVGVDDGGRRRSLQGIDLAMYPSRNGYHVQPIPRALATQVVFEVTG